MKPALYNLLYCSAWNIDGKAWHAMHMAAQSPNSLELSINDFISPREKMEIDENGIAHIAVSGTLGVSLGVDEKLWGDSRYSSISDEVAAAKSEARGIMFHISSPGGMSVGNIETATIASASGIPTASHIEGLGCSAAYAFAAGTDRITATPSSLVGSIGTILPMLDVSGLWSSMGVKPDYITSGDLKAAGYAPSQSSEERAALQQEVDDLGAMFRAHVSKYRSVPADAMRGQAFVGTRAKSVRLIDAVSDYGSAYKSLLKRLS